MKRIRIAAIALVASIAVFTGCQKDTTLTIKPEVKTITGTISFSKTLMPLFTQNCAVAGCHVSGGQTPDLSADNVYNSLVNTPGFVNVKDPQSSKIYEYITGKLSPAMPMGKASNPGDINDLFLAWVEQGAKKN